MRTNAALRRGPEAIVDDEFGLVRWISEVPQDPDDPKIFNYSVKLAETGEYLPLICFTNNGGAALTREHAYRAALGEAVERYCSSVFFKEDLVLGTRAEVSKTRRALGPGEFPLFHPSQHDQVRYGRLAGDMRICWTNAWSLTKKEPVLVPASMVFLPYYPFRGEEGERTIGPGLSTGQASGYRYDDALLGGIYEVVERDAVSIAWLNRLPLARIDIESDEALAKIFQERFARRNLEWLLYDMTTDIRVPSVFCLLIDHATNPPMICTGGATHASAQRAVTKALVETAQTLQWARWLGKRSEPFLIAHDYANIDDFEKHVYLYAYAGMMDRVKFLTDSARTIPVSALPDCARESRAAELAHVSGLIEAAGHEIIVADLTSVDVAECGYRVVKAIIPGLQPLEGDHSHRFLGTPRLYEVPEKLGYPPKHHPRELNNDPHPYP